MSEPVAEAGAASDVLRTSDAGGRLIRGGAIRAAGYGVGLLVGSATAVLLLRYLGVEDFGRYTTVMALIGIVAGITDAGLTAVGSREMAVAAPGGVRARLLANLVTIRLVTTAVGAIAAVAFAAAAGYDAILVAGTALAGVGILLISVQTMMTMPLWVELRIVTLTAFEIGKNVLTLAGIALLVAFGASLLPFFAVPIGVGAIVLAATPLVLGRSTGLVPGFDRAVAASLVRNTLPLALAVVMSVTYVRLLVILMSLLESPEETGLYATAFRVFEVLLVVPGLLFALALPVLSVAGAEDLERLRFGLQRMTEVALAAAVFVVLLVLVTAEAALRLLAGEEYVAAAPVLRIQALALIGVFLGQTWQLGLIAVRRQRAVVVATGAALVAVLIGGFVLIPAAGAVGAAWSAVAAETLLAAFTLAALVRDGRGIAPSFRFVWRLAVPTAAAVAVAFVPVGAWGAAVLAGAVFLALALVTGAIPRELWLALLAPFSREPRA
jgi:O-antigen/teichoic acid export membrane protein